MKHIILLPNYLENEKMLKVRTSTADAGDMPLLHCNPGDPRQPCPLKASEELCACCAGYGGREWQGRDDRGEGVWNSWVSHLARIMPSRLACATGPRRSASPCEGRENHRGEGRKLQLCSIAVLGGFPGAAEKARARLCQKHLFADIFATYHPQAFGDPGACRG